MIWRDFTCLDWTDWSMFWLGVTATVMVLVVCWFGLLILFAYFDKSAQYPRKDAPDKWIEDTGRQPED